MVQNRRISLRLTTFEQNPVTYNRTKSQILQSHVSAVLISLNVLPLQFVPSFPLLS